MTTLPMTTTRSRADLEPQWEQMDAADGDPIAERSAQAESVLAELLTCDLTEAETVEQCDVLARLIAEVRHLRAGGDPLLLHADHPDEWLVPLTPATTAATG